MLCLTVDISVVSFLRYKTKVFAVSIGSCVRRAGFAVLDSNNHSYNCTYQMSP